MSKNEKWEEIYTIEQLRSLQELEFDMLLVLDALCQELGISYFLYGGTLLGAYKFKGFIPWDDDIDIAMPREDYNRFINEATAYLSKDYIIQTPYNEIKSPFAYCKFRIKGTKYIEKFHHLLDIEQGIYIDIYPIDKIPDDNRLKELQYNKIQKLLKVFYFKQCLHIDDETPFISKVKQIFAYWLFRFIPHDYLVRKIDYELTKYNNTDCSRYSCLFYPKSGNYYDTLYPEKEVLFNNKSFKAPNDYEEHLRRRYGDIDKLPPEQERIGHRPFIFELGEIGKEK